MDNMREVKINSLNMGCIWGDDAEGDSKTTTNINKLFMIEIELPKTLVGGALEDFVDDYGGVVYHCLVEYLIEPGVLPWVLECMRPVDPLKWNPFFHDCRFFILLLLSIYVWNLFKTLIKTIE